MYSNLRQARKALNQTLVHVAGKCGTDAGNLSRIERGIQMPDRELARKLFEHFAGQVDLASIYDPAHRESA